MARKDHGLFENAAPNLATCIAELEAMLGGEYDAHRTACLKKTILCLQRRQDHLIRMADPHANNPSRL